MQWQSPHDNDSILSGPTPEGFVAGGLYDAVFTHVKAATGHGILKGGVAVWDTTASGADLGFHVREVQGDDDEEVVGIATKAPADLEIFLVQCYGVYKGAITDTLIAAAGDELGADLGSLGVKIAGAGTINVLGVALAADAGSAGDIFVRCM